MAAELTTLPRKIAILQHPVAGTLLPAVIGPGNNSESWIGRKDRGSKRKEDNDEGWIYHRPYFRKICSNFTKIGSGTPRSWKEGIGLRVSE
jgi:hypothetical protein